MQELRTWSWCLPNKWHFPTQNTEIIWQNTQHGRDSFIINVNSSLSQITNFAKSINLWALTQECKMHIHSEQIQDGIKRATVHHLWVKQMHRSCTVRGYHHKTQQNTKWTWTQQYTLGTDWIPLKSLTVNLALSTVTEETPWNNFLISLIL